ncbi:TerD-family protein [Streptomyces longisporoflavus]|uniref:TerD family protein n=1 Tax=Streptomyces longisporoflavus TaxID=28044 RepID=UPI00167DF5DE|nr:TerD family protein [Streptomyces longisporoflavus]GGV61604.1 TerD-family protein [Streptomyces longisporoflavus]
MSSVSKGIKKVEVGLKWDPSPLGSPPHDLDIIAATYLADAPYDSPVYLVHFDSRAPDGTITLNRDSKTGQGFGFDEIMTLELDRLAAAYARVVVGVAIQPHTHEGEKVFGDIPNTAVRIRTGHTDLAMSDLSAVSGSTAATIAEFTRNETGAWSFRELIRGFDADPTSFATVMGTAI